jgi:hypothetical protein
VVIQLKLYYCHYCSSISGDGGGGGGGGGRSSGIKFLLLSK